jgi:glycosyltransferase involved in cell wall biosynthesis
MHILLIHQAFASLNEAGGTRHYEIAHHLAQHGHQVTIITSPVSYLTGKAKSSRIPWATREFPEPGIEIIRAYVYPSLHKSFFHRLINFFSFMFSSFWIGLGVKNVEAVWGTSPPIFQGWTAWMLARLKHVPFVFEIRDLWPEFAIAIGVLKNKLLINLSYWLESFLYRHADKIVVNSPGFIPFVSQRGGKGIELIPNGVEPEMFDPTNTGQAFRQANQLGNDFVVLYAGAHGISNDLDVLLSAAELTVAHKDIHYVFVGDGKEKANLQQMAAEKQLNNVLFLPAVAKNEMEEVVAAADVCVAILKPLELYKTTYPNKVFDYLAAGRPIVLAIDGVIREVVEAAQAGVFVFPGNSTEMAKAIVELYKDRAGTKKMGLRGREYVCTHFDRSQMAAQFEELFQSITE